MAWSTVSVTLSLVLGLAITRLLSGLVSIFRARSRAELDWIPVCWTVVLLLSLFEVWMVLNELPRREDSFSFPEYVGLGGMMMLLFAAAALLLPPGELEKGDSLRAYFAEEGRFALPIYSLFLGLAAVANVRLLGGDPMSLWFGLDIALILLPLGAFVSRTRRVEELVTAAYMPLFLLDLYVSVAL
jgi:hypothetical protein